MSMEEVWESVRPIDDYKTVYEAVSLAYDEPSEAHSALEALGDYIGELEKEVADLKKRNEELKEVLRQVVCPNCGKEVEV